jgi:hypothetical protein
MDGIAGDPYGPAAGHRRADAHRAQDASLERPAPLPAVCVDALRRQPWRLGDILIHQRVDELDREPVRFG